MHTLWSIDLRKISKIGANRCQILRLRCIKFDFHAGGAYSPPPSPKLYLRGLLLRGGRGKWEKGREEEREGEGREGREERGDGSMHPLGFLKVGVYAIHHQREVVWGAQLPLALLWTTPAAF